MDNHDPARFEREARAVGFTGFGYYPAQGFMHIDTGTPRVWGTPFPKSESTPSFQPEPKAETVVQAITKPEVLAAGGSLLGGATAVAQGDGPIQYAIAAALVIGMIVVGAIVVAGLAATWALTSSTMRAWDRVQVLEEQISDTRRMLDVVTAERAAAEVRARRAQSAREAILSAPDADNGIVAPILQRALEAADEIGGLHE
jgi:hypothetical protein